MSSDNFNFKVLVFLSYSAPAKCTSTVAAAGGATNKPSSVAWIALPAAADTLATSYTLAAAISKIGMPDLIFCGIESIDSNTAQIGPEIAATLGIADVSGASFISFEKEGGLIVTRQNGSSAEVVELKLPAVVTVLPELNKPRYSSIKGILGKGDAELHIITAADLDIDTARIGIKGSPTQVKRVRPIVPPQKENLLIEEKDPQESVDILIEALRKISVI